MNAPAIRINLLRGSRPSLVLVPSKSENPEVQVGAFSAAKLVETMPKEDSEKPADVNGAAVDPEILERLQWTYPHVRGAAAEAVIDNIDPDVQLCLKLADYYFDRAIALYQNPVGSEPTREAIRQHWKNILRFGRTEQEQRAKGIERIVNAFEKWAQPKDDSDGVPYPPDDKGAAYMALEHCAKVFAHDHTMVVKLGTPDTWNVATEFITACRSEDNNAWRDSGNALLYAIGYKPTGDGWRNTPMYLLKKRRKKARK